MSDESSLVVFRKVLALRGPNVWANFPVLEAWIDIGPFEQKPSDVIPGFADRLIAWLPTMIEHRCSVGERGGFFQRLHRGTYLGHILEHVTLELQSLVGTPVGFGRARETSESGVYRVAIEYKNETLARAALQTAFRICMAAASDSPIDMENELSKLRTIAHEACLGPSTGAIVEAAAEMGIPHFRLGSGSMVQLGYGARQRRIWAAETDQTSAIAEAIAKDKQLCRTLLIQAGVPVPRGAEARSADEAWAEAESLGLPVVVKPNDGNHGRGVCTNLMTEQQVRQAFDTASDHGSSVIVEQHIHGKDYRLLVVGGRVVAASRRDPAQVIGDGSMSVLQLIDAANADPRRSDGHSTVLSKISCDEVSLAVLADQELTLNSIPAAGQKVLVRRNANLSTGGTATDVTDWVHPDVVQRSIEAARVVGLDIAGIDIVTEDITKSLESQRGAIVEVNAGPGLRMHLAPSVGQSRPVGKAIVEMLFPQGSSGRIPVVSVTGVNGKTTTTRLIAHILSQVGKVGMTCTDGIYVGGRRVDEGDCSGPKSARAVLMNPNVEVAVFETARGGILREGLAFDRCDIAVVTNIGEGDHLGLHDIHTLEKLAQVKRTIVDVVALDGAAVLNADDPLVAAMAAKCPGRVVFFSHSAANPLLEQARKQGDRVVFVRDQAIVLAEGATEFPLISLERVPLTHSGRVLFQVENVMAAVAATWALKTPCEIIYAGLETFGLSADQTPGRFNMFQLGQARLVVDYGHNTSSLKCLINALDQFTATRRTAVYSTAGDRRNEDIVRQGELLGAAFDRVIVYEGQYLRGRQPGEVISLVQQGLATKSPMPEMVAFNSWEEAARFAIDGAQPGELVMLQADEADETVRFLEVLQAERADMTLLTEPPKKKSSTHSSALRLPE